MLVVFYISGHGLGHATRDIELMHALTAVRPDLRIVVRTSAPEWIFARTARAPIEWQPAEVDTGMVQIDSLRIDEDATAREAAGFYADFDRRVDGEARVIDRLGADVVVGDIPPLAFAAAHRAGVASIAIANFTWDWIYSIYPAFDRRVSGVIPAIEAAYARVDLALRLPLHGGFASMPRIEDIPFIVRRSARGRRDTRRALGIPDDRPAVLASFGGYGVDLPEDRLRQSTRFTFVESSFAALDAHGLRYEDLVAAVDVVVSKPGYGIVSECVANGAALLYASRGRFIEYDLFVAEMPRVLRCREIAQHDLLNGAWADAIDAVLGQPPPPERAATDGAAVAAQRIIEFHEALAQTR